MAKNFWELGVWQRSHKLTVEIYRLTYSFPKEERYALADQMKRASSSIGANLAEGFDRYSFKDKRKFYHYARASAGEVQNFLMLTKDLGYVDEHMARMHFLELIEIKKLINGLVRSIKDRNNE